MTTISEVLTNLKGLNLQDLDYELRRLEGVQEWALDHLGVDYLAGDPVRIVNAPRTNNGWHPYRECLHVGATGVATRIMFVPRFGDRPGRWITDLVLDREWSVSDYPTRETRRYWNGPPDETPDGYEPPSKFDQEHYPAGRRHTFMFNVEWLAKR